MKLSELDDYRGVGGKMTYAKFENLILLADRLIANNDLKKSEYGRGYQSGIREYFDNGQQEAFLDHYFIAEIARRNRSRHVHAFVRGYTDGCKGMDLDMNVSFPHI